MTVLVCFPFYDVDAMVKCTPGNIAAHNLDEMIEALNGKFPYRVCMVPDDERGDIIRYLKRNNIEFCTMSPHPNNKAKYVSSCPSDVQGEVSSHYNFYSIREMREPDAKFNYVLLDEVRPELVIYKVCHHLYGDLDMDTVNVDEKLVIV